MDPTTIMAAVKFLQGGAAPKVLGALGEKLGLGGIDLAALGGGDPAAAPGANVSVALSLLAEHAPVADAGALQAYLDGVAMAVKGMVAVRALAAR